MITLSKSRYSQKIPSAAEMQAFDARTTSPSSELMKRAGKVVTDRLKVLFPRGDAHFLILCGPGNNGGDGFVVGQELLASKYGEVYCILSASTKYSEDLCRERDAYVAAGGSLLLFEESSSGEEIGSFLKSGLSVVVIDALLGTGQDQAPRGAIKALIQKIKVLTSGDSARFSFVALDLPTGVDSDTGVIYEPSLAADFTISIQLLKRGCAQYPARGYCGEVFVEDIEIDSSGSVEFCVLTERDLPYPPFRSPDTHKGREGRVLVLGGSKDMPGAPVLAANAALRSGAGLVVLSQLETVSGPDVSAELVLCKVPAERGFFDASQIECLERELIQASVVVLGPGLGLNEKTKQFTIEVLKILSDMRKPVILDADGLSHFADELHNGTPMSLPNAVLTPHPGEMAKLLGISTDAVQADRYAAARDLSQQLGSAVVLKGASTVVYRGGKGFVNMSGNPYMATAGSGDVLSGIIAALIAQGLSVFGSAILGVHVHARAGDHAYEEISGPIIASDITNHISGALRDRSCGPIVFSE